MSSLSNSHTSWMMDGTESQRTDSWSAFCVNSNVHDLIDGKGWSILTFPGPYSPLERLLNQHGILSLCPSWLLPWLPQTPAPNCCCILGNFPKTYPLVHGSFPEVIDWPDLDFPAGCSTWVTGLWPGFWFLCFEPLRVLKSHSRNPSKRNI